MSESGWLLLPGTAVELALAWLAQCTVAMALALLLARCWKHHAAARQVVLRVSVICALLCPLFALTLKSMGFSILSVELPGPRTTIGSVEEPIEAAWHESDLAAGPACTSVDENIALEFLESSTEPEMSADSRPASAAIGGPATVGLRPRRGTLQYMASFALIAWACGSLVCAVGVLRGWWKLRVVLRRTEAVEDRMLRQILVSLRAQVAPGKFPRVVTSQKVTSPLATGVFRPAIVFPARMCRRLSVDQLRAVLLHELAHVLRRDHLMLACEQWLVACFWFHPLVHLVRRQAVRTREQVCDDYVLQRVDGVDYGETLLRVARMSLSPKTFLGVTGLFDGSWSLEQRVSGFFDERRVLMTRVNLRSTAMVGLVTMAIVTLVGTTTVVAQRPIPRPSGPSATGGADEQSSQPANTQPYASAAADSFGDDTSFPDAAENKLVRKYFYFEKSDARPAASYAYAPLGDQKVAYVEVERVYAEVDRFRQRCRQLAAEVELTSKAAQSKVQEIRALSESLKAIRGEDSDDEAQATLRKLIAQHQADFEQSNKQAKKKFLDAEAEMYLEFYKIVDAAIRAHAEENGIDVVLRRGRPEKSAEGVAGARYGGDRRAVLTLINRPVLYVRQAKDDRPDITSEIIRRIESAAAN